MRKYKTPNTLCEKYFTFWYTGGFIANSLAIINDALHQFFDLSSLVMSLVATWIARWKPNEKKSFGYYRAGRYFRDICQFQSSSVSITLQRGNCVCLNRCKQNDRLGSFTLEAECLLGCKVGYKFTMMSICYLQTGLRLFLKFEQWHGPSAHFTNTHNQEPSQLEHATPILSLYHGIFTH